MGGRGRGHSYRPKRVLHAEQERSHVDGGGHATLIIATGMAGDNCACLNAEDACLVVRVCCCIVCVRTCMRCGCRVQCSGEMGGLLGSGPHPEDALSCNSHQPTPTRIPGWSRSLGKATWRSKLWAGVLAQPGGASTHLLLAQGLRLCHRLLAEVDVERGDCAPCERARARLDDTEPLTHASSTHNQGCNSCTEDCAGNEYVCVQDSLLSDETSCARPGIYTPCRRVFSFHSDLLS